MWDVVYLSFKTPIVLFSFPFLFLSYCHSVVHRVFSIVSDGCNQSSFVFFYGVFESSYGCVNVVFNAGKSYYSLFSWYVGPSISFQTFFVRTFKIVMDSWKFTILLLYILWDDWPIFMISGLNEQLQKEFEYTPLKPDCHSWWISKMQSGRQDTLEEQYAIKLCFKLGKNATETYEYFRLLL